MSIQQRRAAAAAKNQPPAQTEETPLKEQDTQAPAVSKAPEPPPAPAPEPPKLPIPRRKREKLTDFLGVTISKDLINDIDAECKATGASRSAITAIRISKARFNKV